MKREITDTHLRGLLPPATGRVEVADTKVAGLVFRLTSAGKASWSARARTHDGKQTRVTLGEWPAVGIAKARKLANATRSDIWRGADPVAARRAARAAREAQESQPTVAERVAQWQQAKESSWSDRYRREVARILNAEIAPKLGKRPLTTTTRADWTSLIARTHRRSPAVGAMLYRTASAFLAHAEAHGWIETHPLPRKGASLIAPPVAARERVLTDDELVAVWRAAEHLTPKPRAFVRLLAMTACRALEAADIAAGEIDPDSGVWRLPASRAKNRRGHAMSLHPLLLSELRAVLPNHETAPSYRLLGAVKGGGLRGFSKLKVTLDKHAGIAAWRLHDLRRTARTGLTRLGVDKDTAELALNHISHRSELERTYDLADQTDAVLVALRQWQDYVAGLLAPA